LHYVSQVAGHGAITLDGLRRAVREFDVPMSEDELRYMMAEADADAGGSIDRDEFMAIVARAPWY
jgi:Ca2+-binding EF-hand superfamily protein